MAQPQIHELAQVGIGSDGKAHKAIIAFEKGVKLINLATEKDVVIYQICPKSS